MRSAKGVCIAFLLLVIALCAVPAEASADGEIVLSEFCSSNKTLWIDDFGVYSDYVEIYTSGGEPVDLSGYTLSDGGESAPIGEGVFLMPGEYLLIAFSDRENTVKHVPFKLSSGKGETVSLYAPDGSLIASVTLPTLSADETYSLQPGGGYAVVPGTPGAENASGEVYVGDDSASSVYVLPPTFSHVSGFYGGAFALSLTAAPGLSIRYTLNSALPDVDSPLYSQALWIDDPSDSLNLYASITDISTREYLPPEMPVDKAAVVRAIAVDAEGNQSEPITAVYFIGYSEKRLYKNIAVASLVTDPANLFDGETGVYVKGDAYAQWLEETDDPSLTPLTDIPANYYLRGRESEREAHFTFFDENGEMRLSQDIGFRIHGNYSCDRLQKSLNLYARGEYGSGSFEYSFFGDWKLDALMLRGSRNGEEYLRDPLVQSFCEGRAVDTQPYIPCILFLDGEYWGLYYLRTKTDERYISQRYGVAEEDVVIVKNQKLDAGSVFGMDAYRDMLAFAREQDLADPDIYAAFCEIVDMRSYIDYACAQIYCANVDWPNNNEMLWRTMTAGDGAYADGRWRWMLFDLDQTMGFGESQPTTDSLANALKSELFQSLWKSPIFRDEFLLTFIDMANGCFGADRTTQMLEEMDESLRSRFNADKIRFNSGYSAKQRRASKADFEAFLINRLPAIAAILAPDRELFSVTLEENLIGAGNWTLNSIVPEISEGVWSGRYFSGNLLSISASANEGYLFEHWLIDGETVYKDDTLALAMDGDHTVQAVFARLSVLRGADGEFLPGDEGFSYGAQISSLGGARVASDDGGAYAISSPDGWSEGDGACMLVCTAGFERVLFTASLSGGKKAPRDWALYWSADGERFSRVQAEPISVSSDGNTAVRIELPEDCSDRYRVYIRLQVDSGYCINGKARLYGSEEGKITLADCRFEALPKEICLAYYWETVRRAELLGGLYPAIAAIVERYPLGDVPSQRLADEYTESVRNATYETVMKAHTFALSAYAAEDAIAGRIAVDRYADAPVFEVISELSFFDDTASVSARWSGDAYLYAFDGDSLSFAGKVGRVDAGRWRLPEDAGAYIALPDVIENCDVVSLETSPFVPDKKQVAKVFSGFTPCDALALTFSTVDIFDGECSLPIPEWTGGAVAYCYKADGDAFTLAGTGQYFGGELALNGVPGGTYVLSPTSVEEYARQAELREQLLAARLLEESEKREGGRILAAAGGLFLFAALLVFVFCRRRKRSRRDA